MAGSVCWQSSRILELWVSLVSYPEEPRSNRRLEPSCPGRLSCLHSSRPTSLAGTDDEKIVLRSNINHQPQKTLFGSAGETLLSGLLQFPAAELAPQFSLLLRGVCSESLVCLVTPQGERMPLHMSSAEGSLG